MDQCQKTHPSLLGSFQVLELKVPCPRKLLSPRQGKTHCVGEKNNIERNDWPRVISPAHCETMARTQTPYLPATFFILCQTIAKFHEMNRRTEYYTSVQILDSCLTRYMTSGQPVSLTEPYFPYLKDILPNPKGEKM